MKRPKEPRITWKAKGLQEGREGGKGEEDECKEMKFVVAPSEGEGGKEAARERRLCKLQGKAISNTIPSVPSPLPSLQHPKNPSHPLLSPSYM